MLKNLTNHLFKLIKSAYHCKRSIKQCLKQDDNSHTKHLANYYDAHFTALEKSGTLTLGEIETVIEQIHIHRIENQGSDDAQRLLSHVYSFLTELKPFIRENVA